LLLRVGRLDCSTLAVETSSDHNSYQGTKVLDAVSVSDVRVRVHVWAGESEDPTVVTEILPLPAQSNTAWHQALGFSPVRVLYAYACWNGPWHKFWV